MMHVTATHCSNSLFPQSDGMTTKKTPRSVESQKNIPQPGLLVPFHLHCLGGNWEGWIQLFKAGSFLLHIQGLPPVQVGQEIQFQKFGSLHPSFSQLGNGVVQSVSSQSGVSVGERTTDIYIQPYSCQRADTLSSVSREDSCYTEFESFIIGQIAIEEVIGSHETEILSPMLSPIHSTHPSNKRNFNATGSSECAHIESIRVSLPNACGHTIKAYHDFPTGVDLSTMPVVVLAPGYGETKRDYLTLAYYFSSNGFHVLRYDHTNHVGESDGEHYDISLTSMKNDFQAVTQYVATQWPTQPIIGVAASLASRIMLKAEVENSSVSLLISLMGIVDVQQSLAIVHQEDLFAGYLDGNFPESANVLGFNVSNVFLQDALENDFATLESTLRDIQSLSTGVILVSAGKDAWVDQHAIQTVSHVLGSGLVHHQIVPESLHRLQENPKVAHATYRCLVQQCHAHLSMTSVDHVVKDPNRLILGRQKREEKIAQQQQSATELGVHFWQDYLGHFRWIAKCPDYVKLLDHMFHALGPVSSGQSVLDAGCGNGNAGLFFLQTLQAARNGNQARENGHIRYIGVDLVPEALGKAKAQMTQALQEIEYDCSTFSKNLQVSWAQVDLSHSLPFADNQFDQIVSNLVLGYVANPQFALQELYRVLAPGGRMVLSNLKPNGDFSGIYQNLVENAGQPEHREEARRLLHNYGKIRQAEKEDQFRFFDSSEWHTILQSLECLSAGVYPTFANQAYLIVLGKPNMAKSIAQDLVRKAVPSSQSYKVGWSIEEAA